MVLLTYEPTAQASLAESALTLVSTLYVELGAMGPPDARWLAAGRVAVGRVAVGRLAAGRGDAAAPWPTARARHSGRPPR